VAASRVTPSFTAAHMMAVIRVFDVAGVAGSVIEFIEF
jgi:hypothetical protein